ncbi:hypothetical protein ACR3H8_29015 [Pseudomonas aeruginosa]|uniref:Uncharacterized protein n=4 Tax=Gammaproteobacteria TaxID=1236 RepID=A0A7W2R068_9PSED|nr:MULTISPECIES: hypothetical protein [Pseudomonas]HBK52266.1 hypothetical protein [Pseudomonas sp.]AUY31946.1 hypothetical protein C3F42_01300 [Pseudomonas sp. PONIH3]ELS0923908.1 hypothetical protein [Pseudomonas putida]ENY74163.1 hypothetical protein C206_28491 [Pseudomonas putida TRO1]ERY34426.1 hypothetical protein Q066_04013 [Pseudomonas aeruginosa BL12]
MALLQTLYFIPCLGQEITDFLLQTVPLRRRRKVARYLQHVDLWLRHTQYKSLSDSLLPLEAYVYFYLSHITVYPGPAEPTEPRNYYLPVYIDDLLIQRELKGLGRLSNRQAASRIAAAMNWQEHRFGENLDPLRSQMKKLYRQATRFAHATELTAHTKLYSGESLELICGTCRGVEHWVRDLAMLRLLQETGCTTSDLAKAKCTDLLYGYNDEWYFQFGKDKKICLSEGSATLLQVLLGRHHHLEKYRAGHQQLFSMGDVGVEFEMSAHEVEVVLERRYRFALMLSSVNCLSVANLYDPVATPFPEGFVSERAAPTPHLGKIHKAVNLQFTADFDKALERPTSAASEDQYFYEDWDAAIRNSRLALTEPEDLHATERPAETQNANLRQKRVLIAGEGIDEAAWANWGVD